MKEASEGEQSSSDPAASLPAVSFDEFKLYYETTQSVTEQRLTTNRWNYSVSVALMVAVAALVKWASDTPAYLVTGLLSIVALCFVATLFCTHWLRQIEDFKALNKAKFEVLNEMARRVRFPPIDESVVRSYEPFEKEWQRLQQDKAAERIPQLRNVVALRSSSPELFLPRAFRALFVVVALLALISGILSWREAPRNISPFSPVASPPTACPSTTGT